MIHYQMCWAIPVFCHPKYMYQDIFLKTKKKKH